MNLVTVKDISKIRLADISITWIKEDGCCREVHLRDPKGQCIVIRSAGGYSDTLKVFEIGQEEKA